MKGGEKMQTSNVYFPTAPIKSEPKPVRENNSSRKDFSQVLKNTRENSAAQNQDSKTDSSTDKKDIKPNNQDTNQNQQPKDTSSDKSPVKEKPEEEKNQSTSKSEPVDILQLSNMGIILPFVQAVPVKNSSSEQGISFANPSFSDALTGLNQTAPNNKMVAMTNNPSVLVQNTNTIPGANLLPSNSENGTPVNNNIVEQMVPGNAKNAVNGQGKNNQQNSLPFVANLNQAPQDGPLVPTVPQPTLSTKEGTVQMTPTQEKTKDLPVSKPSSNNDISQIVSQNGIVTQKDMQTTKQNTEKQSDQQFLVRTEIVTVPDSLPKDFSQQDKNSAKEQNDLTPLLVPTQNGKTDSPDKINNDFPSSLKNLDNQIIEQVVQKAQIQLKPGQTEMRMHLKPEHLGELQMKLVVEDGKVTAQFLTNNNNVKETLENNLMQLKQNLQDQGIKVEKLSVLIGGGNLQFNQGRKDESFTNNNNQKIAKNWRRINTDNYDIADVPSVEKSDQQILTSEQVDYKV